MRRDSEGGFTILELLISTGTLLALLTGVLGFFSRGQALYNNERETLDMGPGHSNGIRPVYR